MDLLLFIIVLSYWNNLIIMKLECEFIFLAFSRLPIYSGMCVCGCRAVGVGGWTCMDGWLCVYM